MVASRLAVVEIAEVAALRGRSDELAKTFSQAERDYAKSKRDPDRRLAARLAAKRAAAALLGRDVEPGDIEVLPARGAPPGLGLSLQARARLEALGASCALVSLTHGRTQAAAAVVLVRAR